MDFIRAFLSGIALLLTGCGDIRDSASLIGSVSVSAADKRYHGTGLQFASDRFFGTNTQASNRSTAQAGRSSGTSGNTESNRSDTIGFTPDALRPDATQRVQYISHGSVHVQGYWAHKISVGTQVRAGILASHGAAEYILPDGYGVLSDPTRINFQKVSVEPRMELSRTVAHLPYGRLDFNAGLGYEVTYLKTSIRSDLLDIRARQTLRNVVVSVGSELIAQHPDHQIQALVGIKARKAAATPAGYHLYVGIGF